LRLELAAQLLRCGSSHSNAQLVFTRRSQPPEA
jgi:hypothetical protein